MPESSADRAFEKKPQGLAMESFPIDLDARQIVRWVMTKQAASPSMFRTAARRTIEVRTIPERSEFHLGDEEREDLSEVASIGTLEIAPAHASDGWLLTVTVEDEVGPRFSGAEPSPEAEQQMDLGTFYNTFIRPERGTANVVAAVEGPVARAKVTRLLNSIERNQ